MVTAEPEAAVVQNSKLRQTNSHKLNAVSSTVKPDVYKSVADYESLQNSQQQLLLPQQHHFISQQQHGIPHHQHIITHQQQVVPHQQHVIAQPQYIPQPVLQHPLRLQQVPVHHQVLHPQPIAQQTQSNNVALPALHPQTQHQILEFVQRALYTSQQHQQPTAMIIIAQPALMPANVVYGNSAPEQQQYQYYASPSQMR